MDLYRVHRLRRVLVLPFIVFAHVHEHRPGIVCQPFTRLLHRDLRHIRPRLVDEFEKSVRVFHDANLVPLRWEGKRRLGRETGGMKRETGDVKRET